MKKLSKAILFAAFIFSIILVGKAYAQVAVTFNGQPGTDSMLSCNIDSTDSSIAGIPAGLAVPLLVSPDSKIYAVSGDYNVQIDCGDQAGTQNCTNLTNAANTIGEETAGVSNFPHQTNTPSNNLIKYVVGHFNSVYGSYAAEFTTSLLQDDGTAKVTAIIYLDEDWQASDPNMNVTAQLASPNCIASTLVHETGHAFGLGDAYQFNSNSPTAMGTGNVEICDDIAAGQNNIAPLSYDLSSLAAIKAINTNGNSGSPIDVSSAGLCINTCSTGSGQGVFTQGPDGYYGVECQTASDQTSAGQTPSVQSSVAYGTYCNCNPSNGSSPYCVDENGQISAAPASVCSTSGSSGTTTGSDPTDGCSCLSTGPECFDASGNLITTPAEISSDNWCSADTVPAGEVCTCLNGEASCSDSNGSVTPPSNFDCQLPQVSSANTNSYECQDGACTYVGSGGTYSDASCDNACGGD